LREKLSPIRYFEGFRGKNFREKSQKTRNRETFFQRMFLTLYISLKSSKAQNYKVAQNNYKPAQKLQTV